MIWTCGVTQKLKLEIQISKSETNLYVSVKGLLRQPFAGFFGKNIVEWVKKPGLFRVDNPLHNLSKSLKYNKLYPMQPSLLVN